MAILNIDPAEENLDAKRWFLPLREGGLGLFGAHHSCDALFLDAWLAALKRGATRHGLPAADSMLQGLGSVKKGLGETKQDLGTSKAHLGRSKAGLRQGKAGSGHSEAEPGGGKAGLGPGNVGTSRGKAGPGGSKAEPWPGKAAHLDNNRAQKGGAKVYLDRTGVSGSCFLQK